MSVVAELAPAHARGRYQGVSSLAWSAAAFAGPLAGGLALQYLGRSTVWLACAAVGTAASAGYATLLRPPRPTPPPVLPLSPEPREEARA
jgi:MFS family permease